jgi:hypothetical protein
MTETSITKDKLTKEKQVNLMCFTRHGRVRNEDLVFLFLHLVEKWTVMEKCDWIKGVLPNSHQG